MSRGINDEYTDIWENVMKPRKQNAFSKCMVSSSSYRRDNQQRADERVSKVLHDDVCYCKYYEVLYILFHTGMRSLITEDVVQMFQAIIEDRESPKLEKVIDGHTGFIIFDDDGNPLVAMHW